MNRLRNTTRKDINVRIKKAIAEFDPKKRNTQAAAAIMNGRTNIQSFAITQSKTNKREDKTISADIIALVAKVLIDNAKMNSVEERYGLN